MGLKNSELLKVTDYFGRARYASDYIARPGETPFIIVYDTDITKSSHGFTELKPAKPPLICCSGIEFFVTAKRVRIGLFHNGQITRLYADPDDFLTWAVTIAPASSTGFDESQKVSDLFEHARYAADPIDAAKNGEIPFVILSTEDPSKGFTKVKPEMKSQLACCEKIEFFATAESVSMKLYHNGHFTKHHVDTEDFRKWQSSIASAAFTLPDLAKIFQFNHPDFSKPFQSDNTESGEDTASEQTTDSEDAVRDNLIEITWHLKEVDAVRFVPYTELKDMILQIAVDFETCYANADWKELDFREELYAFTDIYACTLILKYFKMACKIQLGEIAEGCCSYIIAEEYCSYPQGTKVDTIINDMVATFIAPIFLSELNL